MAYFVDGQVRRIEASRSDSGPIQSGGQWESVSINFPGTFPGAAWIGMELELLQPGPSPDHLLGRHQLVIADIDGGAWFDDVGIWQLPYI